MPTILETIVEHKREEVCRLKAEGLERTVRTDSGRGFVRALDRRPRLSLIAEVKKASPSRGVIRPDFDPPAIARSYESGGTHAVSVLTDQKFFQGSLEYLTAVREAVALPVLRKEFIIDPLQIEQTAAVNADAVLLIAAILSDRQMEELYSAAGELGIDTLIEVHSARELERVLELSPPLVGINNRDLGTFTVDIATTLRLIESIPSDTAVVSESGIHTGEQTAQLMEAGVSAVLVGESLVKLRDPSVLIRELCHEG